VLLKRGIGGYARGMVARSGDIMAEGNYNVILCERGVRTFAQHTRTRSILRLCRRSDAFRICR